jgi:hypothetical protein
MKIDNKINQYLLKHNCKLNIIFKEIIIDLIKFTNFDYEIFKKILKGAYVIIKDNGFFYKRWVKKYGHDFDTNIFNSFSSHNSCDKTYRLGNGTIYNVDNQKSDSYDFLLGTRKKLSCNIIKNTWFQLERHRMTTIEYIIKHIGNYFSYVIHDENIGPFGESIHTEKKK